MNVRIPARRSSVTLSDTRSREVAGFVSLKDTMSSFLACSQARRTVAHARARYSVYDLA
jgi:hypothetical protein